MPYELVEEKSGVLLRFSGDITVREINMANEESWKHPEWDRHLYNIWDYSRVESFLLSEEEIQTMARTDAIAYTTTPNLQVLYVATNEENRNICERYIQGLDTDAPKPVICSSETEAREWVAANIT